MLLEDMLIVFALLLIFSLVSYHKKLLDFEGILVGNVVGLAAISYAPKPVFAFLTVLVFFLIAEIASNFPIKKHETRNITNVVGNSLPALISILLIVAYPEYSYYLELAFFGAMSAALADTLSSEIGYYSKTKPVMITTFKKVNRGTDGGITLLGELAALFGGVAIAIVYYLAYQNFLAAIIVVLAGLFGTNIDSVFGALFETKKMLNNTQVNLIGSSSGAIFAAIIVLLLGLI